MSIPGATLLSRHRPDASEAASTTLDPRRLNVLRAWFYVGVPLLLGFLLGWLGVGRTAGWPVTVSVLYWIGLSLVATWTQDVATRAIATVLRPLGAPLWFVLIAGLLLAGYTMVAPFVGSYLHALQPLLPAGTPMASESAPLAAFAKRLPSNLLFWVGLNLLFFHGLRMPRFGYAPRGAYAADEAAHVDGSLPTAETGVATATSAAARAADVRGFISRVRHVRRGTAVLALRAEGHYLRVYTDAGSDLVLYRLSDAIAEMAGEPGAQVHRSWWVAERALSAERHADRVRLSNGVDVPISRSYRVAARQRGWLAP